MMLFLFGLELQPSLLMKMRTPILGRGGSVDFEEIDRAWAGVREKE